MISPALNNYTFFDAGWLAGVGIRFEERGGFTLEARFIYSLASNLASELPDTSTHGAALLLGYSF